MPKTSSTSSTSSSSSAKASSAKPTSPKPSSSSEAPTTTPLTHTNKHPTQEFRKTKYGNFSVNNVVVVCLVEGCERSRGNDPSLKGFKLSGMFQTGITRPTKKMRTS
jgi:hypothetical protein